MITSDGFVQRREDGQVVRLAQLKVFRAAAGRDVHDACAVFSGYKVAGDNAIRIAIGRSTERE